MKLTLALTIILSLFALTFFQAPAWSQQPNGKYAAAWKKVDEFVRKGLPRSAAEEVKKIYALAKKENAGAQVIKSLVFLANLQEETREDNAILSIRELEQEIATSSEPVRSILNSLLAGHYLNYYNRNRWVLYSRTATVNFDKNDIATWGTEDFNKKISGLFLASIQNQVLLKQTRLEPFDPIINKGNVRHLRPTLYDLLVHRALNYFRSDERDIRKPAYAFEIDQASAFAPVSVFINTKFITRDSLSLEHKALLLYQELLRFHLNDSKPDALVDADIQRISFVYEKSVHPNKDSLYIRALESITSKYGDLPAASQAWYLIAAWHDRKASGYQPYGDSTYRLARVKAKEILDRILRQKDSSEGKINAWNLLNSIKRQELHFKVEKINLPGQPFRSLVVYKNINRAYLRIIKANEALKKQLETYRHDEFWKTVTTATPIRSWQQDIPDPTDYQQHSVEIKIDPLDAGEYLLVIGTEKDFKLQKAVLGARLFYVSSISFINSGNDYFVLHRDNGQPLAGAAVQLWEQRYDYGSSRYVKEKGAKFTADGNGYFKLARNPEDGGRSSMYLLDITHNNDRLFLDEQIYNYYPYEPGMTQPKPVTSVFLFTDRSLYRPGQTVYFKGIVLTKSADGRSGAVNENYTTTLYLKDANHQTVDSLRLTTNEFGSFSGQFRLPAGGLNGQFHLMTIKDPASVLFRVEDYKRPKFYVEFEPVKGTYKVNDQVTITGVAKAYAGNNIDGGIVSYRVVREPRFIYPWYFWRWWQPPVQPMEITHGEAKTDKDGKFKISFTAIPDLSIDKKFEPLFDYRVYADVTDINGETRSGEKLVTAGFKSLLLKVDVPAVLPVDSLVRLSIRPENMNNEFEPAKLRVTITRLNEEKRLIRQRFWQRPDQFVMTREEYTRNFPHDEYNNESDPASWEKLRAVYDKTDSARSNGEWRIENGGRLEPGYYVIEVTTRDKDGLEVKDSRFIELYDEKSGKISGAKYAWSQGGKPIEPGEKTTVHIGTGADNVFIIKETSRTTEFRPRAESTFEFIRFNNEKKAFEFLATEADRGGFGVNWLFVKHNRFYELSHTIQVPWSNKELKIEYATFRDKMLPGSEEEWKLKISGYKNEKVAAEMLASMYDASLDQFYPHGWSAPNIWYNYSRYRDWNGQYNFSAVESMERRLVDEVYKALDKRYDFFIFDHGDRIYYRRDMDMAAPSMRNGAMEEVVVTGMNKQANQEMDGAKLEGKVQGLDVSAKEKEDRQQQVQQGAEVQVRKNFNETAFFFPQLRTNANGDIEFTFRIPEALTRWKFMAISHTKDLAFGSSTREIITQKQLMVQPNAPRFLREGDKMEFSAKISNLTEKELTGQAELQLFDAATNQPVDGWFSNLHPKQYFTVAAGQSEAVTFPIQVPYQFDKALVWRIVAKAGNFSDGEENALPVLTNRMLVTESLILPVRGTGTKKFSFDKLKTNKSESLKHHSLTIEYTSNPVWYAVQALPYLMEFPYECSEQTWNRYYANSLAAFIANSSPRIRQVFEKWKNTDTSALLSNLQKNQELKAVLLEETPWVLQAKTEQEQKKNIALLFDLVKMSNELSGSFEKLKQMQSPNGGFVWFKGGPDDRYITQYIITGIGHLQKLEAVLKGQDTKLKTILELAIPYLDRKIKEDYDQLVKYKTDLKKYTPGHIQVQYLYMRSFFQGHPVANASRTAVNYFSDRAAKTWTQQSKYMQGMIALAMYRKGDTKTTVNILKSLKETSINHEELGMYWKDQTGRGWFWHQAPIETQALMIEVFQEAGKDVSAVDDLRTWLLKNKQTNSWETTKATAEACYALLLQGTSWLSHEPVVEINLGNLKLNSTDQQGEAGTGYFKKVIEGEKIQSSMGDVSVTVSQPAGQPQLTTWGAVYWQYFEDLDKITSANTPLKLEKKLFIEKNTDRGPVLTPVNNGDYLKVGDKIKVRVELRVDRDMEYVHMKDMRASALEPVNVLSSYKWQGGLGYYETTRDASTNFFFSYLRKGTYVFEYPLFVTHTGNFSNGITSIQCMYAPEFSAHSEGIRINVE